MWRKYISKCIKTIKKLGPEQTTYHTKSTKLTKTCPWKNRHSPPQMLVPIASIVPDTFPSPRTTCPNGHLGPL